MHIGTAGFTEHHAGIADRIGEDLIVARQRPQLFSRRLIEIAEGIGGDIGVEPVGLREDGVEREDDGAEPGQVGDDIGDPRSRPRPLTEPGIGKAPFVDIDDRNRPLGLDPGIDDLEGIEGSNAQFLDRRGVENTQGRESDQERKARQPCVAESARKPPPQYP